MTFRSLLNLVPSYFPNLTVHILLWWYWLIAIPEIHQTCSHHSNFVLANSSTIFCLFLIEFNCFTILFQFLLYNEVNQLFVYIYILPLGTSLLPHPVAPSAFFFWHLLLLKLFPRSQQNFLPMFTEVSLCWNVTSKKKKKTQKKTTTKSLTSLVKRALDNHTPSFHFNTTNHNPSKDEIFCSIIHFSTTLS